MLRFAFRRLGGLLVTLVAASMVVFLSMYLAPGGPEAVILGGRTPTPEIIAAARERFGLDEPLVVRYAHWAMGFVTGDLGQSFVGGQSVAGRISAAAPTTLTLVGMALVLIAVLGIGLGVLAGLSRGAVDSAVNVVGGLMAGVPSFVTATLAIAIFAVGLGWFPAYGRAADGLLDGLRGYVLPAVCFALAASPLLLRVTRQAIREEMHRDYVLTARVRGIRQSAIVWRHVLPNAAPAILTTAGLVVAGLLAASVVVESAFGMHGLGSLLVGAVNQKDFPTVQALTMLLVTVFVGVNAVVDVIVRALDPKVRGAA